MNLLAGKMEKANNTATNAFTLITADEAENHNLKTQLHALDDKVQQMLLWSNICALWSYFVLIIMIVRLYANFEGRHRALMIGSLCSMYVFLAILLFIAWKNVAYKRTNLKKASKTYLQYQIKTLAGQCKLISFYLLIYAVILAIASAFFFMDIRNGLTLILKLTAPVSTVTYLLGLYFILKFKRQQRKLEVLDRRIDYTTFMQKVQQN